MHPRRPLLALIGCSILLTACTPAEPTPTPTPTPEPTYQCTPIFGGDPTTCTQQDYDDLQAKLAQYTEAEQIYTESLTLLWTLVGERQPANDELKATATGAYLESITQDLDYYKDIDIEMSGHQEVAWTAPLQQSDEGSDLAITACIAPGDFTMKTDTDTAPDSWYLHYVFFTVTDGQLLISRVKGEPTDEC